MKLIKIPTYPNSNREKNVEAQTSPIKETSSQVSGSDTESLLGNQTRSKPIQCPNDSKKQQNKTQRNETDMTSMTMEMTTFPLPKLQVRKMKNDL